MVVKEAAIPAALLFAFNLLANTSTVTIYWIGTVLLADDLGSSFSEILGPRWTAVAEQGVLATASTTLLWNWGLKRVPASHAGIFVNLEPLIGAVLGVWVLHEVLGWMALVGGVLIIGGAVYFSYKPGRSDP